MRKTKIICTLGPTSDTKEMIKALCEAGMNTARLNFSHGSHSDHKKKIDIIKEVREELNLPIAIMLDTKGPEYRIGCFNSSTGGKITVEARQGFTFTTEDIIGNQNEVSVSYKNLHDELNVGDLITVNNGLVTFEVSCVEDKRIVCNTIIGGELSDKKSMSFPNKVLHQEYLSEQDKSDLLFGIENDADFVAASFVSTKEDIKSIRDFLDANGGKDIELIAKIENRAGVDNIEEICEIADGIMVARGDLGVEIPFIEVPAIQKHLIKKCRLLGKIVITATEMLESMIHNPRPTRAEISDVANAVYDGSSAIMLSGETANGKFPIEAVNNMARIAEYTEKSINYSEKFYKTDFKIGNNLDAISHAASAMAIDTKAKCLVISSITGKTAKMISRFRCPADIIAITPSKKNWRQLNLSWGVTPLLTSTFDSVEVMFYMAKMKAIDYLGLKSGDNIVMTGGKINGHSGNTNTIKLEIVE